LVFQPLSIELVLRHGNRYLSGHEEGHPEEFH
jgi:hypothetical protein